MRHRCAHTACVVAFLAASACSSSSHEADAALDAAVSDVDGGTDAATGVDATLDADRDAGGDAGGDAQMDAGMDGAIDAAVSGPARDATRPVAPLSGSTVSTDRPMLHWSREAGADDVRVMLCSDRDCRRPLQTFESAATSGMPVLASSPGVVFWRVIPRVAGVLGVPSATWQLTVPHRSAPHDAAWGATPDFDGDGHADVLVTGVDLITGAHRVDLFRSGMSGLGATPDVVITTPGDPTSYLAVRAVGDVNGDGRVDAIVASVPSAGPSDVNVYFGVAAGLATTPGVTLHASVGAVFYGSSVAAPGDLDGDGYGDLVVASGVPSGVAMQWHVDVYRGGPSGPSEPPLASFDLGGLVSGTPGLTLTSAGDVTGDGVCDVVVVGETGYEVHAGSALGLEPTASLVVPFPPPDIVLHEASSAGDVDGDGWTDVLVVGESADGMHRGQNLHLGTPSGLSPTPSATIDGTVSPFSLFASAGAGDLDGDGYGDVVIISTATDLGMSTGHVYLGSPSGLSATTTETFAFVLAGGPFPLMSSLDQYAVIGDANGDARADVQVVESSLHVHLMTGHPTTPTLLSFGATPDL